VTLSTLCLGMHICELNRPMVSKMPHPVCSLPSGCRTHEFHFRDTSFSLAKYFAKLSRRKSEWPQMRVDSLFYRKST